MKSFKLLSRLFTVFGMVMIFGVSGWASNNPIVSLSCTPNTLMEGNSGTQTVTCTISLDQAPDTNQIKLQVASTGTATAVTDYTGPSAGTFSFAKDTVTLTQTFTYSVKGDTTVESDETVIATLSDNGTNNVQQTYTFSNTAQTTTIFNDDISTASSNHRIFTQVYNTNDVGNIKMIGNSVLTTASGCQTGSNNDYSATNADFDGNSSTFNSTSADLNLSSVKSASDILYAGLYWQGRFIPTANLGTNAGAARTVKLQLPGSGYQTLTSNAAKFNWSIISTGKADYQGVYDITQLLKSNVSLKAASTTGYNQTIWVADVKTDVNATNLYGAWSIVVVYKDTTASFKNLTVYDGYQGINNNAANNNIQVPLSGFLTPNIYPINSNFLIFGGEGDKYYGDSVTLSNGSGDKYLNSSGIHEVFDSTITDANGNTVTNRTPACANTMGVDIHTYNIGKTSAADTNGIIETGQTSTTVKLSSFALSNADWPTYDPLISDTQANSYDTFFPGVFAFSTDLYQPYMCYQEEIYKSDGTPLTGTGNQVNKDDILRVKVTVKNTGSDTAKGVQILHPFDDAKFPYKTATTKYNNFDSAGNRIIVSPATDSSDNDLFDYYFDNTNSNSNIINKNVGKTKLGKDANATDGGDFIIYTSGSQTFAEYEYNATVKQFDQNFSNTYYAAYKSSIAGGLDYSNNPVQMDLCTGTKTSFYGYSAPVSATGDFNVVYHSNWPNALGNYYYNLPTAIASRADNYKVISLSSGTDNLKDANVTVAVELVDVDSSANCSSRTALNSRVWVKFNNQNATNFTGDVIAQYYDSSKTASTSIKDEEFYQKAGKNVAFRISANTDASNNLIQLTTLNSGLTKLTNFPNFAEGQNCGANFVIPNGGSNQIVTWCANNGQGNGQNGMTQSELFTCMECIFGINTQKVCSRDNFAIRPEAFYVKLNDQNQTNFVTKQAMSNNISGAVSLNLASGYQYYAEVNATNHVDNNATFGYTTTEGLDSIWTPAGTVVTGCNDDTNKSAVLNFSNGIVEANLSVDQVGKYSLNITDDRWANVDSNVSAMSGYRSPTPASFFLSGTDCTLNSGVTSALGSYNGCNISSNHVNSDAGITYVDTAVEYRPYDFNLTSIQMSRGQNFAGTIMGQNTWTYMNSVNLNENMSVRYFGPIRPVGKTGTLLSNYVNNCYAQPVNMDLNLTFPVTALPNWSYRLQEVNATTVWRDTNGTFLLPASNASFPLATIPQTSFLKNQNGLSDMNLSLNFDRNQTLTVNPITVGLKNFQIKCQVPGNCSSRADFSTTHLPDANVTTDNNTTFVYGRIIPRDVRVFGSVPFTANGWYEVFNAPTIGATTLPASKNDATWYTNILHNDVGDGDANVTAVVTATSTTLPVSSVSNATGIESYLFNAETPPYGAKAHIATDPWLWYGTNASAYANPGTDCMTHPCFNINVVPAVGATGSAKTGAETKKASKKSTSEAGAGGWKSTSDYAPAIR